MKRWKKIIQNCPYLLAVSVMWIFFTVGSIGLMKYRDERELNWQEIWKTPFFAIATQKEMQGKMTEPALALHTEAEQEEIENKEITDVIIKELERSSGLQNSAGTYGNNKKQENDYKLNYDLINERFGDFNSIKPVQKPMENLPEIPMKIGEDAALDTAYGKSETTEEIEETDKEKDIETDKEETENAAKAENIAETKKEQKGQTRFIIYPPSKTDSIYYTDAGRRALTTEYAYQKVEEDYFTDAAFIGDSRTLGIADYAGLEADFYCENGMTIYKLFGEKGITWQKNGQKVSLSQILQQKQYGKIYLMLGMNELGYGNTEQYLEQYQAVVEQIRAWQPNAVIFIMANLHVSREKNNLETEFNNININDKNAASASLADGETIFYLDSNPLFTDNNGMLKEDLTFDGVHLYANNYQAWKNFLMEHGVVIERAEDGRTDSSVK